eukprot:359903-Chlamydomonas_euryale.AAC.2
MGWTRARGWRRRSPGVRFDPRAADASEQAGAGVQAGSGGAHSPRRLARAAACVGGRPGERDACCSCYGASSPFPTPTSHHLSSLSKLKWERGRIFDRATDIGALQGPTHMRRKKRAPAVKVSLHTSRSQYARAQQGRCGFPALRHLVCDAARVFSSPSRVPSSRECIYGQKPVPHHFRRFRSFALELIEAPSKEGLIAGSEEAFNNCGATLSGV